MIDFLYILQNNNDRVLCTLSIEILDSAVIVICCTLYIVLHTKRLYTRGTIRGIRRSQLSELPTLYHNWWRSLN